MKLAGNLTYFEIFILNTLTPDQNIFAN